MDLLSPQSNDDRVQLATAGDSVALKLLLTNTTAPVRDLIRGRIPPDLARVVDAEDVLQEADIEVFRRVGLFTGQTVEAFVRWRCAIAMSRLRNAIRNHRAIKRGGAAAMAPAMVQRSVEDSTIALLDLLPAAGKTPSRWMARDELLDCVQAAIDQLPARNRQAVWLIHIEGQSAHEAAARMACTERAIHGLCRRGLEILGDQLRQANVLESRG